MISMISPRAFALANRAASNAAWRLSRKVQVTPLWRISKPSLSRIPSEILRFQARMIGRASTPVYWLWVGHGIEEIF